ncbi:uncharacterized protein LOC122529267 [Frieseomelitta varia]|uniref:uncharacterized protein LOC122529267 n=1 Tax=Frieseomelitta varia TaxID=561572 RepID=UPI001CB6971B|nr:uncharacterized protein LOC122529267 [Frieseomelitta varia]
MNEFWNVNGVEGFAVRQSNIAGNLLSTAAVDQNIRTTLRRASPRRHVNKHGAHDAIEVRSRRRAGSLGYPERSSRANNPKAPLSKKKNRGTPGYTRGPMKLFIPQRRPTLSSISSLPDPNDGHSPAST